jgi:N-acetylglutamate synthase-like GNAT family acetyltransferase
MTLTTYEPQMKQDMESFFAECFAALGWKFEPVGRHSDIANISDTYLANGQFWCLYDKGRIIGTVAVRVIDAASPSAELKRLYVLPSRQGEGLGNMLFETALKYVKENGFKKVCADTRRDRTASQHLMIKHGFTEAPKYNDNDFAELFFELELS